MTVPKVSVIMIVYDAEQYLRQSIDSILRQTFSDFEFIIVSEHDTSPESLKIIRSYRDGRIHHVRNPRRIGLTGSRNIGLREARGKYVAIMDADDVSAEDRLRKQVEFLDGHPDVGVIGSSYDIIDEKGTVVSRQTIPSDPVFIRWLLPFGDFIPHSSLMVRSALCDRLRGYDPQLPFAEDYDFLVRAAEMTDISNLSQQMLQLRKHAKSVSKHNPHALQEIAFQISGKAFCATFRQRVPSDTLRVLTTHSLRDTGAAIEAAQFLYGSAVAYITQNCESKEQVRLIRLDASERLYILALLSAKRDLLRSWKVWYLMVRSYPQRSLEHLVATIRRAVGYGSRLLSRRSLEMDYLTRY